MLFSVVYLVQTGQAFSLKIFLADTSSAGDIEVEAMDMDADVDDDESETTSHRTESTSSHGVVCTKKSSGIVVVCEEVCWW